MFLLFYITSKIYLLLSISFVTTVEVNYTNTNYNLTGYFQLYASYFDSESYFPSPEQIKDQLYKFSDRIILKCSSPTSKTLVQTNSNDPDILQKIDLTKNLGIFIHGWLTRITDYGIKNTVENWINYRDDNVCAIDWSSLAFDDYKTAALRDTQIVATYLSEFLNNLNINYNYPFVKVTLVGHSLGAQITGFTGQLVNGKIGFIIGLDPASSRFAYPVLVDVNHRLSIDDALFVQVVHTSDPIVGFPHPLGHQNFYINRGTPPQPGCLWPFLVDTTHSDPIACSHYRSPQFFMDSLKPGSLCIGIQCENIGAYRLRICSQVTDRMGLDSNRTLGQFFLVTRSHPVCIGKYWQLE